MRQQPAPRHLRDLVVVLATVAAACGGPCSPPGPGRPSTEAADVPTAVETQPVSSDADDPAIWIHPSDPSRSLIIGTDKVERTGGLYVFGLDGRIKQVAAPLDRPNNVDVEYGLHLGGGTADIVVVTERKQQRLRVYRIGDTAPPLTELSADEGIRVLAGAAGEWAEPMGIALYKRPRDGVVFAIVAPKSGPAVDYLWQYRLDDDGRGRVRATPVRRFGAFSRVGAEPGDVGEIEAVVVDDTLGYVYYADERFGIRKYHADPDHPEAARELAAFGREGYRGDREGLAIYARPNGTGYIVSADQVPGSTRLRLFPREGAPGHPHDHREVVGEVTTVADSTDGLDVTSMAVPGFPQGFAVLMNSAGRNFQVYAWQDLAPR
jgi:3-phytase